MAAPVYYEELPGSPSIDIGRKDGTGKRVVRIAWADISLFLQEIYPDPASGYLYGAVMPGFPWLVATRVGITPWDENRARADVDTWEDWHDYAEVTVNYGIPTDDQQQQSGPAGDGTGPGGSGGSSGGSEVTFLSHKISLGSEFITWPGDALQWELDALAQGQIPPPVEITTVTMFDVDAAGTILSVSGVSLPRGQELVVQIDAEIMKINGVTVEQDTRSMTFKVERGFQKTVAAAHAVQAYATIRNANAAPSRAKALTSDVACAVATPLIDHTIEWNYVAFPPWLAMRQLMGKVNAYWFAGAPPETCLFLGGECSRDITSTGVKAWKMSYKLSEKNMNALNPNNPQGWNHFLRPNGREAGTFQRIRKKVPLAYGAVPDTVSIGAITATQQTLTVLDTGPPFPQTGQFFIELDDELMAVQGILSPTSWAVLRGIRSTAAVPHISNGLVTQVSSGVYEVADMRYLFVM